MEAFLIYLVKSSIVLSLFYIVYFFLLRKDTFFTVNRHFLLTGIISALLLPLLEFTTIEFIEQPNFQIIEVNSSTADASENQTTPIDWRLILFNTYIIITSILLIRFIFQLISLRRILKKSPNKRNNGFSFLKTKEDIAPFSFFKYIIFNPALHGSKELEMIIKHEKIHAKQYHTLDILITNIFVIFQWVNPFSWMYKKSLQQNLEFIADQEAVRDIPSKKEYQLTLVKVSSNNYSSITNNFYQSLIKKRIVMLNKKESKNQNLWKATIILPLLCLFLWSFNTKTENQYIQTEASDQVTTTIEEKAPNENDDTLVEEKFPAKEENLTKKEYPINNNRAKEEKTTLPTKFPKQENVSKNKTDTKKEIYPKSKKNTIEFIINKKSTKKELEKIKRILKNEYDVKVTFSDIKRDNNSDITSINIDISSKKSNTNFSLSNDSPIKPFVLSYDSKEDKINIGQSNNNIWISKNKGSKHSDKHIIEINSDDDQESIFMVEGDKKHNKKKSSKNKIILRGDDNSDGLIISHSDNQKTLFDFDNDSDNDPLFIIDGKEASKKEVKKLKSDEIQTIDVSKGKAGIRKYGKKAKDGVIHITTKKNVKKETGFDIRIDKKDIQIGSSNNNEIKPLIFINGKESDYDKLQEFNPDQIASVNVYKSLKAITKYGSKGENGVIEITLKK
ncbi:Signal transducer regulating beta-lactamase production, contains metallopeptidase domain [Aquimarina amphilecti]|uniref:Signal transducer regulating beta-lactamase production, contains metallopeptidase domain n=1 Tax=Aquimarina amphilecti TaxID=1038014 RepID=A0A1H7UBZ6_AQUAM|nr:M56 family metallopeptidase [Aquimarina amphilecti]SEL94533.1 Signal transducer regulating beta-lactamase production, contains metallopeptidase domain [Aquimarina amphilecti]